MSETTKNCTQCGAQMNASGMFCPQCGTRQEAAAPVEQPAATESTQLFPDGVTRETQKSESIPLAETNHTEVSEGSIVAEKISTLPELDGVPSTVVPDAVTPQEQVPVTEQFGYAQTDVASVVPDNEQIPVQQTPPTQAAQAIPQPMMQNGQPMQQPMMQNGQPMQQPMMQNGMQMQPGVVQPQLPPKKPFPWFYVIVSGLIGLGIIYWSMSFFNILFDYPAPAMSEDAQRWLIFFGAIVLMIWNISMRIRYRGKKKRIIPNILLVLIALVIVYAFGMIEMVEGDGLHDMLVNLTDSVKNMLGM